MSARHLGVALLLALLAVEARGQQSYQNSQQSPSLSQRFRAFRDSVLGSPQDNGNMRNGNNGNGMQPNQGNGQRMNNGGGNRQIGPRPGQSGNRNTGNGGMPQNRMNQQQPQTQPPLPQPDEESVQPAPRISGAPSSSRTPSSQQQNGAPAVASRPSSSRRTAQPAYQKSNDDSSDEESVSTYRRGSRSTDTEQDASSETDEIAAAPKKTAADPGDVIEDPDQMVYVPKSKSSRRRPQTKAPPADEQEDDSAAPPVATKKSLTSPRVANSAKTKDSSGDLPRIEGPQGNSSGRHAGEFVLTNRGPNLRVETSGPKRVMVGKPGVYKVTMHNAGEVPAEDVIVTVQVPAWAEVVAAEATAGESRDAGRDRMAGEFHWVLSRVDARGHEELTLQIVARENRAFDMQVQCACSPTAAQTKVEVQEAKLQIELSGPREVSYGEKSVYKLTLSNAGTADAENVIVKLSPLGSGDEPAESHAIGRVSAGSSKTVEVELVARQDGQVKIQVQAEADGGLKATASESVTVRRAAIKVAVEAPKFRYSGAVATYNLVVSNPGNDPARETLVTVQLPRGAQFTSCSTGGERTNNGAVVWRIDNLRAGEERRFQLKCVLETPGANRLQATATASGELTHSVAMTTQVEALADLTLDVNDPQGAVPVGEDVVYEIVIRNRGSKAAEEVEVTAAFSDGLDPLSVTGEGHRVQDNKVIFDKIATMAAGQERTLKIRAQASRGGSHKVRVEARCPGMETALVEEESTRFYGNDDEETSDDSARLETPAESDAAEPAQFKPLKPLKRQTTSRRPDRSRRSTERTSHVSGDWAPARSASSSREPQRLEEPADLHPVDDRP